MLNIIPGIEIVHPPALPISNGLCVSGAAGAPRGLDDRPTRPHSSISMLDTSVIFTPSRTQEALLGRIGR